MIRPRRHGLIAIPHRRGMGTLNYYDLLAQANLQNCDPRDTVCVSNNAAKQAAVEDLWVSKYEVTGAPDNTRLTFAPQTAAEVTEFYNPANPAYGGNVIDTRGVMTFTGNDPIAPPAPPPPVPPPAKAPAPTPGTPGGAKVINGSGVMQPASSSLPASSSGFDLSSIPLWGWAAAAGVAFFAFGGHRG